MPYRIVVDTEACEGYAKCVEHAADVFKLGDDLPVTLLSDRPGDGVRERMEKAVKSCPRAALKIVDE